MLCKHAFCCLHNGSPSKLHHTALSFSYHISLTLVALSLLPFHLVVLFCITFPHPPFSPKWLCLLWFYSSLALPACRICTPLPVPFPALCLTYSLPPVCHFLGGHWYCVCVFCVEQEESWTGQHGRQAKQQARQASRDRFWTLPTGRQEVLVTLGHVSGICGYGQTDMDMA